MRVCVCVYIRVCVFVCVCVCIHTHTHIHAHIYVSTRAYISRHTHSQSFISLERRPTIEAKETYIHTHGVGKRDLHAHSQSLTSLDRTSICVCWRSIVAVCSLIALACAAITVSFSVAILFSSSCAAVIFSWRAMKQ